jgi:hypothetical protein
MLLSTALDNQRLIEHARTINSAGILVQSGSYVFLNIDNAYIHELFDLLDPAYDAQKPDYFSSEKSAGAHITVFYNEEDVQFDPKEVGKCHTFSVIDLHKVTLNNKEYFVLMISSPSLRELRIKHNLTDKPRYKGYSIDFHITIAVKAL